MRMHLLALALLAAPSAALGEHPRSKPYTPPRELAQFKMGKLKTGEYAWYREYAGPDGQSRWRVWANPVGHDNWYRPPFEIRDSLPVKLGIDEPAMAARIPRIGTTTLGGPDAGKTEPAGGAGAAEAGDCGHIHDAIDAFCLYRWWRQNRETIKAGGLVLLVATGAWWIARRTR